jgi:peptide-N4-(N-acetyl-beta-glucosaminyl)asparagine amidase
VLSSESERLEEELRFSDSDEAEEECQIMVAEAQSLGPAQKAAWGCQDCVVRALMRWFKRSFLTWVKHPICGRCNSATVVVGLTAPFPKEQAQEAEKIELYKCAQETCGNYE